VFTGNGAGLSQLAGANVTGTVANATFATSAGSATTAGTVTTAAQPNITSVGFLTGLSVSNGTVVTTLFGNGDISAFGRVTASTLTSNVSTGTAPFVVTSTTQVANLNAATAGTATSATTAGTVTTAAQPNITSLGTLTSLGVNGTVTAVAFTANTGVFTGNANGLSSLQAGNLTGTVAQARLANSSLTVNGTSIALGGSGTITATATNALTIGTGLGGTSYNGSAGVTITNTGVTSIVAGTNIGISGGTGAVTVNVTGTVPTATTAGTVTTAAQPNITSVGTLTGLTLSGTLSGAVQIGTGAATHFGTALTTGANTTAGTVTGNWTLTAGSRWQSTYADLAERYVADEAYEPGTVVVLGGDQEVTIENIADSHKVAGVVTTNPAYIMNTKLEGDNVVEVALIGRVPCKVVGPVSKGDLLTSAEVAGHAHSNNNALAGRIIGKALENFAGETGIIEIMVGKT
jgi:hypothetical protein